MITASFQLCRQFKGKKISPQMQSLLLLRTQPSQASDKRTRAISRVTSDSNKINWTTQTTQGGVNKLVYGQHFAKQCIGCHTSQCCRALVAPRYFNGTEPPQSRLKYMLLVQFLSQSNQFLFFNQGCSRNELKNKGCINYSQK